MLYGAAQAISLGYVSTGALQVFGIGALAVDIPALVIFPLFNIEVEPIEYEKAPPLVTPIIP